MNWFTRFWAWLEAWGDADLQAGPLPVVGIVVGAVLNALGLLAGAPWWARLVAVLVLAFIGRFTSLLGKKMEGWHLEVVGGAWVAEMTSWFICHGPCR